MDTDELKTQAETAFGKAQEQAGKALDDPGLEAKGQVRQFKAGAESAANSAANAARDAIGKVADQAKDAINRVADQASGLYATAADRAQDVAETVDPWVKERPYAALGLAALAGFVFGVLYAGRGPRTIYVRPRD